MHSRLVHLAAHLLRDLWRIRGTGAQHYLRTGRHVANRIDQMRHTLLARDTTHKEHIRQRRIDPIRRQRGSIGSFLILSQIDAVVDHMNALRINLRIGLNNVGLRPIRYRNDGVSIKDRGALHP